MATFPVLFTHEETGAPIVGLTVTLEFVPGYGGFPLLYETHTTDANGYISAGVPEPAYAYNLARMLGELPPYEPISEVLYRNYLPGKFWEQIGDYIYQVTVYDKRPVIVGGLTVQEAAPTPDPPAVALGNAILGAAAPLPVYRALSSRITLTEVALVATVRIVNEFGDPLEEMRWRAPLERNEGAYQGTTGGDGLVYLYDRRVTGVELLIACGEGTSLEIDWSTYAGEILELVYKPEACIDPEPVNELNFLRWFPAQNYILPVDKCPTFCQDCGSMEPEDMAVYRTVSSPNDGLEYSLPAVVTDRIRFFINTPSPFNYSDPSELRIGLLRHGNLVPGAASGLGTLSRLAALSGTGYFLHGDFTLPPVADGLYNLCIYRLTNKSVLLVSNTLRVCNGDRWNLETLRVKYASSRDFINIPYKRLPAGFAQEYRLDVSLLNEQIVYDSKSYTTMTGAKRESKLRMTKTIELHTDYFDRPAHDAAAAMLAHTSLFINGHQYSRQEGYEIEYSGEYPLALAKAKLLDAEFNISASPC